MKKPRKWNSSNNYYVTTYKVTTFHNPSLRNEDDLAARDGGLRKLHNKIACVDTVERQVAASASTAEAIERLVSQQRHKQLKKPSENIESSRNMETKNNEKKTRNVA